MPGHGPDGDCHLWRGARSKSGAGVLTDATGINFKAHRVAHWLHYGYMPEELFCIHACGVTECVNPRHLYLSSNKKGDAPARIMRLVDQSPGQGPTKECWHFKGYCEQKAGYGVFSGSDQRAYPAHRYMYELVNGVLPAHVMVCHRCDNPPCCNPDHLFAGSHTDNMVDRNSKGRQARTRGNSKLTEHEARQIKLDPRPHHEIAVAFVISRSTVSFIKSGRRWVNL